MMKRTTERKESQRPFRPYGSAIELWKSTDKEVVLSGPAGTGKSRGCLEKIWYCAHKYPGARILIARKTRASLTESGLVTFEKHVIPEGHPITMGPSRRNRERYVVKHDKGDDSEIIVSGLDHPTRIMSTEYDLIYVQEAIELTITDWESLSTRMRNGRMPYQQLMADTNPDSPTHWLYKRCEEGKARFIYCSHEDNPVLFDHAKGEWRPAGVSYIERLEGLSGARKQRLRYGKWVQAEGVVYEHWDPEKSLIERFDIPTEWPRYWAVDFGYTNPFVWQAWAKNPDNGKLYLYKEIYETKKLVTDLAEEIKYETRGEPDPLYVICDHDAEGREQFTQITGMNTTKAFKKVKEGIQQVERTLRRQSDGEPGLFIFRDSLVRTDPLLKQAHRPTRTAEEFDSYVWDTTAAKKEEPKKEHDHGMDALRYLVAHVTGISVKEGEFF